MSVSSHISSERLRFSLVGPPKCGKTALLSAIRNEQIADKYLSTIRVSSEEFIRNIGEKLITVCIKDGPGPLEIISDEQWLDLVEDSHGILLVFDVTDKKSLTDLSVYTKKVLTTNPRAKLILIGNKIDDVVYQEVEESDGKRYADAIHHCEGGYVEVSAKRGIRVNEAVDALALKCLGLSSALPKAAMSSNSMISSNINASQSTMSLSNRKASRVSSSGRRHTVLNVNISKKYHNDESSNYSMLGQWYVPMDERDDFLDKLRERLDIGIRVLVYPHGGGSPSYLTLLLKYPFTRLSFFKKKKHKDDIIIDDIAEIRPYSEKSFTFSAMNIPRVGEGVNHLFTIIASEKTTPLATDTAEDCLFLVKGLKLVLECAIPSNIKRLRGKDAATESKLSKIIENNNEIDPQIGERVKFKLKQGIDIWHVRENGLKKERVLSIDGSEKRIVVLRHRIVDVVVKHSSVFQNVSQYFEGPDPGIDISDISEVRPGYSSNLFAKAEPPPDPNKEYLALSIIGSEGTISMLMKSSDEKDFLLTDFVTWLHSKRMSTSIY